MHGGVVGELLLGQTIPPAARSEPEADAVQHGSPIGAGASGPFRRVVFGEDGLIFSHNSSGTRQIVGSIFSWVERSPIGASYSQGSPTMILDREGFEIVT